MTIDAQTVGIALIVAAIAAFAVALASNGRPERRLAWRLAVAVLALLLVSLLVIVIVPVLTLDMRDF